MRGRGTSASERTKSSSSELSFSIEKPPPPRATIWGVADRIARLALCVGSPNSYVRLPWRGRARYGLSSEIHAPRAGHPTRRAMCVDCIRQAAHARAWAADCASKDNVLLTRARGQTDFSMRLHRPSVPMLQAERADAPTVSVDDERARQNERACDLPQARGQALPP